MDAFFTALGTIIAIPIVIVVLVIAFILFKLRYKVAKGNQALVITGGKKGVTVLTAGGAFISPLKRHEFFPLDVMTVTSSDKETQTKTVVPVVVTWTAQLKPDTETEGSLGKAVMGFIGRKQDEMERSLQQTLEGEVRAVVATLTPEEVIEGRDKFKADVEENVKERMAELGFKLISLNITEVRDNNGHYDNIAAQDREAKRESASKLKAAAQKEIDVAQADASKLSEEAQLAKDLAIAEKVRDTEVKKAAYKKETDVAQQDAEYAGKVRAQEREKDLAVQTGAVKVEQEKQNKVAAEARRDVVTTEAETAKQKQTIEAKAAAEKASIDADARVVIAEKDAEAEAKAAERRATGKATAIQAEAEGRASARKTEADAEAEAILKTRKANAEGIAAEGEAEAKSILAKGKAEAEAEKAKADALAANDGVNFEVLKAEIESKTRIQVSTAIATAVAEVGTNTTIIDMGGGTKSGGGDLLTNLLGSLPETLAKLDVSNMALNGKSFTGSFNELVTAVTNKDPRAAIEPSKLATKAAGVVATVKAADAIFGEDEATDADFKEVVETEVIPTTDDDTTKEESVENEPASKDRLAEIYAEQGAAEAERQANVAEQLEVATTDEEESDAIADEDPMLVSEAKEAVANIAEEYDLDEETALEVAKVYADVKDAGIYDDDELYGMAREAASTFRRLHQAGEPVKPRDIAKAVIGQNTDGNVGASEVIDFIANLGKTAASKKKRR